MMMTKAFRMKVTDMFFLEDKTVFVGLLETEAEFLGPGPCRLLIDGHERARFGLEGENLFRPDFQSVWTKEKVCLSRDEIVSGESWLISE